MGGISSLDTNAQERIKDTARVVLETFLKQYVRAYGRVLLQHARLKEEDRKRFELAAAGKLESSTMPLLETYRLQERPKFLSRCPLIEGKLTKQGVIHKSWKERHFVVRPDFCIEYYETDQCYRLSQKPKGTIIPSGYIVNANVQDAQRVRLTQLAGKMNSVQDDLPALAQWPEFTFEIYHERRRCYYISASTMEEKIKWVEVFRNAVRNNKNYAKTDPASVAAFELAVTKCRQELGHWSTWSFGGTEEEVLVDMVISDLEDTLLGDVYLGLKGSLANRLKTRQQLMARLVSMVTDSVNMILEKMKAQEHMIHLETKDLLGQNMMAVDITDREMTAQLRDLADELLIPWIGEHVVPVLPDMLKLLTEKVDAAFTEARYVFDSKIAGLFDAIRADKEPLVKNHHDLLCTLSFNYEEMHRVIDKLKALEQILIGFREHFNDVQPWRVIYSVQTRIMKVLDNACYSYQDLVLKDLATAGDRSPPIAGLPVERLRLKEAMLVANTKIIGMLEDDSELAAVEFYKETFLSIIKPQVLRTIYHGVKPVTDSLNHSIPDSFRPVLFASDLFEALLDGLIERRVDVVLDALGKRVRLEFHRT
ncbi:PH domain-containing protein DDB_G0267786-like [Sycon ciliatum]|uniref:PH domain-containing protein DDB_G0267786-like n=1 Tax=Sycon ciliatum TaxID=27933 RepID=UPI0031F67256